MKSSTDSIRHQLPWVEWIKGFAIAWIFLNHLSVDYFGYPLIGNPVPHWPGFSDRVAQLLPLTQYGIWNLPVNLLRYVGWSGRQGVALFLILSGFGLTWGFLSLGVNGPIPYRSYLQKRALRLYPLWWGVHLIFIATWVLTGWGLSLADKNTYLSLAGLRVTPGSFYYFAPAWWYFGLILQLYLVFPLLWEGLRRLGPGRLLILVMAISFPIRAVGLFTLTGYLDVWQQGGVFITRLPEFAFGISFAAWLYQKPERLAGTLRSWKTVCLLVCVYLAGMLASLTLPGMIFAPFALGISLFLLLFVVLEKSLSRMPSWLAKGGIWAGKHSYAIYLIHQPIILSLVPMGALLTLSTLGRSVAALLLTAVLAVPLEWGVAQASTLVQQQARRALILLGGLLGVRKGDQRPS